MIKNLQFFGLLLASACSLPQAFGASEISVNGEMLKAGNLENAVMIPSKELKSVQRKAMDNTRAEEHKWKYIGQGKWYEPLLKKQLFFEVSVEECEDHPGEVRLNCVLDNGEDYFTIPPIIHCENHQKVYMEEYQYNCGYYYNNKYGYYRVSQHCRENGWNYNEYGKLENNIIEFPGNYFSIKENGTWYKLDSAYSFEVDLPENYTPGIAAVPTTSGVYFGITAFNYLPEIMPMELLTVDNKKDYKNFVNSREKESYTYLYYSVEQALKALKSKKYPDDLKKVALITFTDGNDDGSLEMLDDKSWDDEDYQKYIENLIANAKVQGVDVNAFSIGLPGNDINDTNYALFQSNLKALATEPKDKNATEVEDMKEVENTLNEILDGLEKSWLNKKVNCRINMRATGDKIRFTLDKTREEMNYDPENSDLWIEGVFSREDNSMNDIIYHGCTSSSGSKVISKEVYDEKNRKKYQFTFENLKDLEGNHLNTGEIHFWHATKNNPFAWQPHSEFVEENGAETETERSSAAIMFVMDCSSSLGDDFLELQRVANGIIDRLAPDAVEGGVEDVQVDSDTTVEYYTLQGIKVANPSYGIYIVKKGNKVRKVMFGK